MPRPRLIIAPGKDKALLRRHPWIFSGAVRRIDGRPADGDLVDVIAADGTWLAAGHYQAGESIICKVLSFDTPDIDDAFFRQRLLSAIDYRRRLGFNITPLANRRGGEATNVFRLVHAEGDLLPGLVADWYNGVLVLQAHSVGMHRLFPLFVDLFRDLLGDALLAVFDKSSATLPIPDASTDGFLWQNSQFSTLNSQLSTHEVCESSNRLLINFFEGQKTGFFIDQRDNRLLVQSLAAGRRVLNCFGYTGGFSLAALRGGAEFVETVDISRKAIDLCNANVALNFGPDAPHRGTVADVLQYLSGKLKVESGQWPVASGQNSVASDQCADASTAAAQLTTDHCPLTTKKPAAAQLTTDHCPLTTEYDFVVLDPPAFAKTHRTLQQGLKGYRRINQAAMEMLPPGGLLMTFSCSQAVSVDDFRTMVFTAAIAAHRDVRIVRVLPHAADHPVSVYHPEGEYLKGLLLEVR